MFLGTRLSIFQPSTSAGTITQWTHNAIITSLLHRNDATTSFWLDNNVSIASHVRWEGNHGHDHLILLYTLHMYWIYKQSLHIMHYNIQIKPFRTTFMTTVFAQHVYNRLGIRSPPQVWSHRRCHVWLLLRKSPLRPRKIHGVDGGSMTNGICVFWNK